MTEIATIDWFEGGGDLFSVKTLLYFLQSFILKFLKWVYLSNYSSESIHIWTIGTLVGQLLFHDSRPQGVCPRVGLEDKS